MTERPYLSVVVTSRNDNHGGNLLQRMQVFVNGLLEQCDRHQIPMELVLVEWNPPQDKPPLAASLSWPKPSDFTQIRIITVAPEIHSHFQASDVLFIYQMIARNVGIRRSQAEFILSTSVDQVFSEALFEWLSKRPLESGVFYRLDRHDVSIKLSPYRSIQEQLQDCEQHRLRIHTLDGVVILEQPDSQSNEASPEQHSPANSVLKQWTPLINTLRPLYRTLLPTALRDRILDQFPSSFKAQLVERGLLNVKPELPRPEDCLISAKKFLQENGYPQLYTRNCGDFMLMSRENWFTLRGYPELEVYSTHLGALLCHAAHQLGIRQEILPDPLRAYHLEHGAGWTPDGDRDLVLRARLDGIGVPYISQAEFDTLARLMQKLNKPLPFNDSDWGMADQNLPETQPI